MSDEIKVKSMVCGFCFGDDGRVALIRKARPAWMAGKLNGVGGKREMGEDPLDAMHREFSEETGFKGRLAWEHFLLLTGQTGEERWEVWFYRATIASPILGLLGNPDVTEPVYIMDTHRIPPMQIMPNLRWILPLASDRTGVRFPLKIEEVPKT